MNMLKMCLNWKVLAGLAVVAVAVYIVAPDAFAAALPVLLLLACPLSMIVMMVGMRGTASEQPGPATAQVQSAPLTSNASLTREQQLAQLRSQLLGLGEQQVTLARQIEELERPDAPQEAASAAPAIGSSR